MRTIIKMLERNQGAITVKKVKGLLLTALCLPSLALPGLAQAEVKFIEMSYKAWQTEIDGSLTIDEADYDLSTDNFEFEKENNSTFSFRAENDTPWVPNIYLATTRLTHEGAGTLYYGTDNLGLPRAYDVGVGEVDMSHIDLSLYYNVFEHQLAEVSVGLTGKFFIGELSLRDINGTTQDLDSDLNSEFPFIYFGLDSEPLENLRFSMDAHYGKDSEQEGLDLALEASYTFKNNVGLGIGYQILETTLESKQDTLGLLISDLNFEGGFARIFYVYE